ncbi:MAG: hypothetical protein R2879_07770 [Saprospiraceae bacterium]
MKIRTLLLLFSLAFLSLNCEKEPAPFGFILYNTSFEEGTPGASVTPKGWYDCGFPGETAPDLHSSLQQNAFDVNKKAQDGNQYVGLVTRNNNTWECLQQDFEKPISGNFTIRLLVARSEIYLSSNRTDGSLSNYVTPVVLRVIGVDASGNETVLFKSNRIINTRWEEIIATIQVPFQMTAIRLSPYYKEPFLFPYNGNVLIDLFEMY